MAAPLNPGFKNNMTILAIRSEGTMTQIYTDLRPIDANGDDVLEHDSFTQDAGGNIGPNGGKASFTYSEPAGSRHTVVASATEVDGGVDKTGSGRFTRGVK